MFTLLITLLLTPTLTVIITIIFITTNTCPPTTPGPSSSAHLSLSILPPLCLLSIRKLLSNLIEGAEAAALASARITLLPFVPHLLIAWSLLPLLLVLLFCHRGPSLHYNYPICSYSCSSISASPPTPLLAPPLTSPRPFTPPPFLETSKPSPPPPLPPPLLFFGSRDTKGGIQYGRGCCGVH